MPKKELKREAIADVQGLLDASEVPAAEERLARVVRKYEKTAPKLAARLEANVSESLTVLRLPPSHRLRLRGTNMLERLTTS